MSVLLPFINNILQPFRGQSLAPPLFRIRPLKRSFSKRKERFSVNIAYE